MKCPLLSIGNAVLALRPDWNGESKLVECIKGECAFWLVIPHKAFDEENCSIPIIACRIKEE